jgi:hypothetical protein
MADGGVADVAGESLEDGPEREVARQAGEAANALRHHLEDRQGDGRSAPTEIEDVRARQEEGPRGSDGDGRATFTGGSNGAS